MASVSIVLAMRSEDVDVRVTPAGGSDGFVVLRLDEPAVSIVLCGFNAESAAHARTIAAKLLAAADELAPRTTPQQPTPEGKDAFV
jgi:hypothetical protein